MTTIVTVDAETDLSTLLDKVEAGEEVVIARNGKPVARLVGVQQVDRARLDESFEKLKALRKGSSLGGLSWKNLRDEGRR